MGNKTSSPNKGLDAQQKKESHPLGQQGPYLRFKKYDASTSTIHLTVLFVRYEGPRARPRLHLHHRLAMHLTDKIDFLQPQSPPASNGSSAKPGDKSGEQISVNAAASNGTAANPAPPQLSYTDLGSKEDGFPKATKVQPMLLDMIDGWHFYRFDLAIVCGKQERLIAYQVHDPARKSEAPKFNFHVPAATQGWHFAFHSCNGFHELKNVKKYKGVQPLWRDLMKRHAEKPLHLAVGGGDQLYCDYVWHIPTLTKWCRTPNRSERDNLPYDAEMKAEVEKAYLLLYLEHWNQPVFRDALASIPQVMTWDDHDIFDGWGSYPEKLQATPVFQGVYSTARKLYALFQQHTTPENAMKDCEFFGSNGGWNWLSQLGPKHALLLPDMRGERCMDRIVSKESWGLVEQRLLGLPESVEHVIIVSAVPLIFPEIPSALPVARCFNAMGDSCQGTVRYMQENGLGPEVFNAFGTVDILNDLLDGWNADVHTQERQELITMLQGVAERKRVRISFLAGDVHCAALAAYSSAEASEKEEDFRYMVHVTSSAIGNAPPPNALVPLLKKAGVKKQFNEVTVQHLMDMLRAGDTIRNKRNWCEVVADTGLPAPHAGYEGQPVVGGSSVTFHLRFERHNPSSKLPHHHVGVDTCSVVAPPLR